MKLITKLRVDQDKTEFRLGADAYVNPTHVSAIERGREVPRPDSVVLVRLADALGYEGNPADLLEDVS